MPSTLTRTEEIIGKPLAKDVLTVRKNGRTVYTGTVTDRNDVPIDISSKTITAEIGFYRANVDPTSTTNFFTTDPLKIAGSSNHTVPVTPKDATNGTFTVVVEGSVFPEEITYVYNGAAIGFLRVYVLDDTINETSGRKKPFVTPLWYIQDEV